MTFELNYHIAVLAAVLSGCFYLVKIYCSKDRPISVKAAKTLFVLKFLILLLFVLVIFDPVIIRTYDEEKPLAHLVLFDNSRSIALNDPGDSIHFKQTAEKIIGETDFPIYLFGEKVRAFTDISELDFSDRFTNVSTSDMKSLLESFGQEKSAASVTIVTDANFTDASDISVIPNVPVNIIYSSVRKKGPDLFIKDLYYDDTVSSVNSSKFDLTVGYTGEYYSGNMSINVTSGDRLIKTITADVPQPGTYSSHTVTLPAPDSEYREAVFSVEADFEERNIYNNSTRAYQRTSGLSGKLAVLAGNNSLDLTFLEKILSDNGYRFDTFFTNDITGLIGDGNYKALITVGLPEDDSPDLSNIVRSFNASLHFIGPRTDTASLGRITGTDTGEMPYIPSEDFIAEADDGKGSYLFMRNAAPVELSNLPPVKFNSAFTPNVPNLVPLARFAKGPHAAHPVYQKSTGSSNRIIANFSSFWRTALNDPDNLFGSFILNLTDQASLDRSKERILISLSKTEFVAGETVVFHGRILDENLHSVTNAQASLEIRQAGFTAPFILRNRNYSAAAVINEPGIYDAYITVTEGGRELEKTFSFRVSENDLEAFVLGTDTLAAERFAASRDGELVHISRAEEFFENKKGEVFTHNVKNTSRPARTAYFFIIFAALFIAELTLRKYYDLS